MHHPRWTLGWETTGTSAGTQRDPVAPMSAVTLDKAGLPGQPLCPSNHCMPLAGTGVASTRAAKWM